MSPHCSCFPHGHVSISDFQISSLADRFWSLSRPTKRSPLKVCNLGWSVVKLEKGERVHGRYISMLHHDHLVITKLNGSIKNATLVLQQIWAPPRVGQKTGMKSIPVNHSGPVWGTELITACLLSHRRISSKTLTLRSLPHPHPPILHLTKEMFLFLHFSGMTKWSFINIFYLCFMLRLLSWIPEENFTAAASWSTNSGFSLLLTVSRDSTASPSDWVCFRILF